MIILATRVIRSTLVYALARILGSRVMVYTLRMELTLPRKKRQIIALMSLRRKLVKRQKPPLKRTLAPVHVITDEAPYKESRPK